MFIGEGKRKALERFRAGTESIAELPINILYELPESVVLSDLE